MICVTGPILQPQEIGHPYAIFFSKENGHSLMNLAPPIMVVLWEYGLALALVTWPNILFREQSTGGYNSRPTEDQQQLN